MSRPNRFTHSRIPAQKLADRIVTQCQGKNRIAELNGQIGTQESLKRQADITILKYKKEIRLIEAKMVTLPEDRRELHKMQKVREEAKKQDDTAVPPTEEILADNKN